MVQITAIYVGGPDDGKTEQVEARPDPGDPPGTLRVYGFDLWRSLGDGPVGHYEPDTSAGGLTVPFIWREYTPEEQANKLNDPNLPIRKLELNRLERVFVRKPFLGTWISRWVIRRASPWPKDADKD